MLQFVIAMSAKMKGLFRTAWTVLEQIQIEVVLCSLLAGVLLTVFLQFLFFKLRFGQLPVLPPPIKDQYPKIKLPQVNNAHRTGVNNNNNNNNVNNRIRICCWFLLLFF